MPIWIRPPKKTTAALMTFAQFYQKNIVEPLKNYLSNHRHAWYQWFAAIGADIAKEVEPAVTTAQSLLGTYGAPVKEALEAAFADLAKDALQAVTGNLEKNRDVQPSDFANIGGQAIADAFSFGLASYGVSMAFELLLPEKLNTLNGLGPVLATLAGFEEVTKNVMGPTLHAGVGIPAMYDANSKFRSIFPSAGAALQLASRGLISDADCETLLGYAGAQRAFTDAEKAGAYRGLNPRQMLRLIETDIFTQSEIADELTFSGMRPVSQTRMLSAAPYLATATYRSQLHASLHTAYLAGLLADQDYTNAIDAAENNTGRDSLILQRAQLDKQVQVAKELESAYSAEFLANVTDEPTYRSMLSGLGLQDDRVNALAAVADAKMAASLARQAAAAERALERQTISAERKTALQNFKSGTIDATAYAAALILTGLTPTQTAAWVDLAVLQAQGNPTKLFGLSLAPAQAQVLRERVTALTDQRKKLMITESAFVQALQALGIPAININALNAAAAAEITPAASATLVPVSTQ